MYKYLERDGIIVNKSHSVAYALITYQTAWLKAHYPAEFMASLISLESEMSQSALYIENAKHMGINVLPPDLNQSGRDFTISDGGDILFGFQTIKGIGDKAIDQIIQLQPFGSFEDFLIKTSAIRSVNKKVYEVLIKCGACDYFGYTRSAMLANFELYLADWVKAQPTTTDAIWLRSTTGNYFNNEEYPELPLLEILEFEKQLVGIHISGTPFEIVEQAVNIKTSSSLSFLEGQSNFIGSIMCQIVEVKKHKAPSGDMAFLTVTDKTGLVNNEFVVFPRQYKELALGLVKNAFVLISFKLETKGSKKSFIVEQAINLNEKVGATARKIAKKTEINHIDVFISGIPSTPRMKTLHKTLGEYVSDTPTPYTVNIKCTSEFVTFDFGKYFLKHISLDTIRAFNAIQDIHVSRGSSA